MNNTSDFIYSVPAKLLQEGMHTHKTKDSWFIPAGIVESCTHAYVGVSGTAYVYVTLQNDPSTYVSEANRYVSVIEPR